MIKLNDDGSRISYSSYIGGSEADGSNHVAVDGQGKIYVVSDTQSMDFPTANGYRMTANKEPSSPMVCLTKIDPEKTGAESLLYSTYIGRPSVSSGFTVDRQGRAYILAMSTGAYLTPTSFPNTTDLQPEKRFARAVLITLDPSLSGASSYVSAVLFAKSSTPDITQATDVAVDSSGNIYLGGSTQSYDFPEVNNTQVAGSFITSPDSGKSFVSRQITTPHSANLQGDITFVTADPRNPSTAYAGNSQVGHLLYKTTDGGASWNEMDFGGSNSIPSTVAIDPQNPAIVYAGMKYASSLVYKSTDEGQSWAAAGPPAYGSEANAIVIDPQNPSTVYVGPEQSSGEASVLKTTDAGNTWNATGARLAGIDVTALAIDPKDPSAILAGTVAGLFKSPDGGKTWNDTGITKYIVSLAQDPQTPSTIYAGLADDDFRVTSIDGRGNPRRRITITALNVLEGVVKSTDGGQTWKTINDGFGQTLVPLAKSIAIDPRNPSVLYAGMFEGLYKSTDGGGHWSFNGSVYNLINAVAVSAPPASGPSTLFVGTRITNKAFILKLDPQGKKILYSTYVGGNGWFQCDLGSSIAADDAGNVYLAGTSYSSNFPTKNAFQKSQDLNDRVFANVSFLMKVDTLHNPPSSGPDPALKITDVSVSGKNLIVTGENFSMGAVIVLDDEERPTVNDPQTPTTALLSKKTGKKVKPGRSVTIQVKNADGAMSQQFQYVRPEN